MRLSSLWFLIEEAARNIRRNGLMSLASLTTVAITMAVLGGALFTLHRLYQFAEAQPRQFEIQIFLDAEATREQSESVKKRIEELSSVAHVALIPREKALREMEERDRANDTEIVAGLEGANPLPDRLDVRLRDPRDTGQFTQWLGDRKRFPEVEKVLDAHETLEMLFSAQRTVRNVGLAVAALLFVGTAFVIQNTIRLTVFARRREIRIMQLVGATPGFIRFPMVLEGIFYGVAGSAVAAGLVLFVVSQISRFVDRFVSPIEQIMPPPVGPWASLGLLIVLGAAIGWAGSVVSIRRFLKRI